MPSHLEDCHTGCHLLAVPSTSSIAAPEGHPHKARRQPAKHIASTLCMTRICSLGNVNGESIKEHANWPKLAHWDDRIVTAEHLECGFAQRQPGHRQENLFQPEEKPAAVGPPYELAS